MASKRKSRPRATNSSARKRQTILKFPNSTSGSTEGHSSADAGQASSSALRTRGDTATTSGSKPRNRNAGGSTNTSSLRHARGLATTDSNSDSDDGGDDATSPSIDRAKNFAATTKTDGGGAKAAAPIARTRARPAPVAAGSHKTGYGNVFPARVGLRSNTNFAVVVNTPKTKAKLDEPIHAEEGSNGENKDNGGGDESEDDEPVRGSSRKRYRGEIPSGSGEKDAAASPTDENKQDSDTSGDDEAVVSSEDESIITPAAKKRQKSTFNHSTTLRKGKKIAESDDSDLEPLTIEKNKDSLDNIGATKSVLSEDGESDRTPRKRKLVRILTDDDDRDLESPTPKKKKTVVSDDGESDLELLRSPSKSSPQEESDGDLEQPALSKGIQDEEDIEEDMELASENVVLDRRERKGGSSRKVAFREKFAHLRAKRRQKAGITESSSPGPTPSSDGDGDGGDSDPILDDEDLNQDLDSFIVEDNPDDLIGAPDVQIPLEFTAAAHESNSEQFRLYVEYLVHDALFPNTIVKGPVEINAIRRLEMVTTSFGTSVTQSGAWSASFIRALKARPTLVSGSCLVSEHCDACNRNNQNATRTVQFIGRRYDEDDLNDLSSDEDEESTDDRGEELFPEDKVFKLGIMCYTRAVSAHTLFHWKKELKGWVEKRLKSVGYIDGDGDLVDECIDDKSIEEQKAIVVEANRKLGKDIKDLYGDFERTVNLSREGMEAKKWRGGGSTTFI